ncbi:MAG: efflux transporter outer membrane subunit [Pseudomonadota bacterium]
MKRTIWPGMRRRFHPRLAAGLTAAACGLAACVTPPPSPEPQATIAIPATFNAVDVESQIDTETRDWWTRFDDPLLIRLVEEALSRNRQLALAQANIATARAQLASQLLGRSYSTTSTASADLGRAARDGADVELSATGNLGASWEYDAFGRIEAQIESARFDLIATEEARRDVAVIIAGETARAYADLRGGQIRLAVAERNAELQGDSLELLRTLAENGRATRLDIERAESQYRTTLATLPQLQSDLLTAAARLATLTGYPNAAAAPLVNEALDGSLGIPEPPLTLSGATPEDMIRRRPDIRAAEADIASFLALGEVERANLFPTLTFNANIFTLFNDTNDLSDSFGFGLGPGIRWDGPDLRSVRADIDIADARTQAAFVAYENTVISALGEVEIALTEYAQELSRRNDLEIAAGSAERAAELALLRFEEGLDDFLDVIDAQRTLLVAQDRLEQSRLESTRRAIAAYRALGGIWTTDALDAAAQSEEPN